MLGTKRKKRVLALLMVGGVVGLLAACEPAKPDFTCEEGVGDLSDATAVVPTVSC